MSATRDAAALHAIFSDNLGESCILLTDADATSEAVRKDLIELGSRSTPDDVVVVTFAGHGTDTHQIVTYDTNPDDLERTAISLKELTDLAFAIPARLLLIALDCCFSGAAGMRVLNTDLLPRTMSTSGPDPAASLLSKLTGKGRVVLTASAADQRAWESRRLGHGLLTHSLLDALLDSARIATDGRFDLHDLLKDVTRRVKASASGVVGALQDPAVRFAAEGNVFWPVFSRGRRYNTLFPPASPIPVTSDVHSLSGHGIPDAILAAWPDGLVLNQLQQDAVNEAGILRGNNVLAMAPTSAGKTLIGEICAVHATQTGGRAVFLLPTKALVNEQYWHFNRVYGQAGIRVVRATGDITDQLPVLLRGQFDIAVLTYEKFSGLALTHEYLLRLVAVVVIDEIQTIMDPVRGPNLELLLTLVKTRREDGVQAQVVALSAVLGELGGLDSWLEARLLSRTDRPVPLDEGVLGQDGWYRYLDSNRMERREKLLDHANRAVNPQAVLASLVAELVAEGQQVMVVRDTRASVRNSARELADLLNLPAAAQALAELPAGDQNLTNADLRRCLTGGVAFHSAELDYEERRVIEEQYRLPGSPIRVVVSTTTLAQGVNLPAQTVVIPELSRLRRQVSAWYGVAEYKNIAGRAGRLGLTHRGRAIVLAHSPADAETLWKKYIIGRPEDVRSALLGPQPDVETAVLRTTAITTVRAGRHDVTPNDLVMVLTQSLAAHQARLLGIRDVFEPARLAHALENLRRAEFTEEAEAGRITLTSLGAAVARGGMTVRSASRVAHAFRAAQPDQMNAATMVTALQLTEEFDGLGMPLGNGRQLRAENSRLAHTLASQGVAPAVLDAIRLPADDWTTATRVKTAVALLLWINGNRAHDLELVLTQGLDDHHVIGPVRRAAARAHDLVETVVGIAADLHPAADLASVSRHLPAQLELGIAEGFAPLAVSGAGLDREHYLALHAAGLTTPDLVGQASDEELLKHLRSARRLGTLRLAIDACTAAEAVPSLDHLLPPRR